MLKNKYIKKAFTLIELLVVITIIWILATGGIAVFTKQLQAARDSTRIKDIKLLETATTLYFSDKDEFPKPSSFTWDVESYMSKQVQDPKPKKPVCWGNNWTDDSHDYQCGWIYIRADDEYWLENAAFKLAVFFEKEENFSDKAKNNWEKWDGWSEDSMYETFWWAWAGSGLTLTLGKNIDTIATSTFGGTNPEGALVY